MIAGHPHPGHLPARQVETPRRPGTRAQIIDGRAAAGRRGDGVEVDAVDHAAARWLPRRDGPGHDTRAGASSSWPSLPGR